MKRDVWLKANRRIILLSIPAPAIVVLLGVFVLWSNRGMWQVVGLLMTLCGGGMMLMLVGQWLRPRLALCDGRLLVWLRAGPPLEVPLEIVECFFLSRADATPSDGQGRMKVVSLAVRLAEAATQYRRRTVKPALGRWADGYIMIRGTWCEPLSLELVNGLNRKLRDAQRRTKESAPARDVS